MADFFVIRYGCDMARPKNLRGGRKPRAEGASKAIAVRLAPAELEHLRRVAAAWGVSESEAIRRALAAVELPSKAAATELGQE